MHTFNHVESLEARWLLSSTPQTVTAKNKDHVLRVTGTNGADIIEISESSGTISVLSSGNSIYSGPASSTKAIDIKGENGNDSITEDSSVDVDTFILDRDGQDTITSNNTDPTVIVARGTGNDSITAGNGETIVRPSDGNDTITLGDGEDGVTFGKGDDTVTLGNSTSKFGDLVIAGPNETVTFGQPQQAGAYNYFFSIKGDDTITSVGPDHLWLKPNDVVNGNSSDVIYLGGDATSNLTGTTGATINAKWPRDGAAALRDAKARFGKVIQKFRRL